MKPCLLIFFIIFTFLPCLAAETNGCLVFEVERFPYTATHHNGPGITQKFKVPLTGELLANFKHLPNKNSSGTGFCCGGGDLTANPGSTRFMWWLEKTSDSRWYIHMWGMGVETINGVTLNSRNPNNTQSLTINRLEDLDMSYQLSFVNKYDGINISFSARYESAKDIAAGDSIPTAPVLRADRSVLFKGDDSDKYPTKISCLFQEN